MAFEINSSMIIAIFSLAIVGIIIGIIYYDETVISKRYECTYYLSLDNQTLTCIKDVQKWSIDYKCNDGNIYFEKDSGDLGVREVCKRIKQ